MGSKRNERLLRLREHEGHSDKNAAPSDKDWEAYDYTFRYRGERIPVYFDDYGQSLYFFYKGKEYGCGSFNPDPSYEIKAAVDESKDLYDVITVKGIIGIKVMRCRGIKRLFGLVRFHRPGTFPAEWVVCRKSDYRRKIESEISEFMRTR